MPTFHSFDTTLQPEAGSWTLPGEESHHLSKVLRARCGDTVCILDGNGRKAVGELTDANPKQAVVKIAEILEYPKPQPQVCLAVCIPKPKTVETVVRQATEMGVSEIRLLGSKRSEVPKAFLESPKKSEKLQKIAQEACKQSENPFLPVIHMGQPLIEWLEETPAEGIHWIAHPTRWSQSRFPKPDPSQRKMWILIGAEGGLTEDEFSLGQSKGFAPVNLGNTVLRVETACVAICAKAVF